MTANQKSRSKWMVLAGLLCCVAFMVPAARADGAYLGVKRCSPCHLNEFKSWEQTKMAKDFDLLKPGVDADIKKSHGVDPNKDYTKDPSCVECHTTGYGKGGFTSIEATPDLAGITCEACHGPGGGYVKPQLMSLTNKEFKLADVKAAGMVMPDVKTCLGCHNSKSPFVGKGYVFDYEQRKKQGVHAILPLKYKH